MFLMINKFHQQFEFVEDEIQSDHGGKFRWEQSSSAQWSCDLDTGLSSDLSRAPTLSSHWLGKTSLLLSTISSSTEVILYYLAKVHDLSIPNNLDFVISKEIGIWADQFIFLWQWCHQVCNCNHHNPYIPNVGRDPGWLPRWCSSWLAYCHLHSSQQPRCHPLDYTENTYGQTVDCRLAGHCARPQWGCSAMAS